MNVASFRAAMARRPKETPTCMLDVIRERLDLANVLDVFDDQPSGARRQPLPAAGPPRVRDVLHPLEWLDRRAQVEAFGSVPTMSTWESQLFLERQAMRVQYAKPVRVAPTRHPKYARLARRLDLHLRSTAVDAACTDWLRHTKGGHLDVSNEESLAMWLDFLTVTGIPASQIILRVPRAEEHLLESINTVAAMQLGCRLAIDKVDPNHGLQRCYLLISSEAVRAGESPPPAAVSMAGFNTLFLAACVANNLR
jgi:hypothetical protein